MICASTTGVLDETRTVVSGCLNERLQAVLNIGYGSPS